MRLALLVVALSSGLAFAQPAVHRCAAAAVEQAGKLLTFHFGPDARIDLDKTVRVLAPLKNPANPKQVFEVLEIGGSIYKGRYRMRLIYAQLPGDCVLMGQEILELATL